MGNKTETIQQRQEIILKGLSNPFIKSLMSEMTAQEQINFKNNLLELGANAKFLLEKVEPKRIVKLALDLTKDGFNINPYFREVSIVPFKIKDSADYAPSPIIHLKGWQERLYLGGFFLKVDKVWKIGGVEKRESEMTLSELSAIDDTDQKFREDSFLGFVIIVEDLKRELPAQERFVSYKYTKIATKKAQMPKEFELQGLVHKAIRRALGEMVIPRARLSIRDYDYNLSELESTESQPQPQNLKPISEVLDNKDDKQVEPEQLENNMPEPEVKDIDTLLEEARVSKNIKEYQRLMDIKLGKQND